MGFGIALYQPGLFCFFFFLKDVSVRWKMKGQTWQTQDCLLEESPLEIRQSYVSLGPGMTYLAGRVMRTHVRTVCFSAWFLMGTRLMQSYCLCVCVYILLPNNFWTHCSTSTGGLEVPGALLVLLASIISRVRLQVLTAAGVSMAQPGEQCRAAGNGTATVLLVHHTAHSTLHIPHCTSCCSFLTLLSLSSLISCFVTSVKRG